MKLSAAPPSAERAVERDDVPALVGTGSVADGAPGTTNKDAS